MNAISHGVSLLQERNLQEGLDEKRILDQMYFKETSVDRRNCEYGFHG